MWKFLSLFVVVCLFAACQGEADQSERSPIEEVPTTTDQPIQQGEDMQQPPQSDRPQQVNIPAGPDGIVHHYICSDLCEGGHSESPGNCPVCNHPLAHNQAWHDQQQPQQQQQQPQGDQDPRSQFDPMRGGDAPQDQQQQQQQAPEQVNIPAGADGVVHHYICVDRCQGGHSESPGVCPVCSKQLAHNQAWHNQ